MPPSTSFRSSYETDALRAHRKACQARATQDAAQIADRAAKRAHDSASRIKAARGQK